MARDKKKMGRPKGRKYPEQWQMYSSADQRRAWINAAQSRGLRGVNDWLRLAGDHALTCALFLPATFPKATIDQESTDADRV